MSKSIKSLFIKSKNSSSSRKYYVPSVDKELANDVDTANEDKTVKNLSTINDSHANSELFPRYHPKKSLKLKNSTFEKRERPCQHQWFNDFNWLHYDMKKDGVFCSYCMARYEKLTAEGNKYPAYISTEIKSWKKAPACVKEQEQSKCHTAALPYKTVVPKCAIL